MNLPWVIITGASSGIGKALALEWASRKTHRLILVARSLDLLNDLAKQCSLFTETRVQLLDLEQETTIKDLVESLKREGITPGVVIHNAGISQRSLGLSTELSVTRRIFEINFFGTVLLTQKILPLMLSRGGGKFIVVTSLVGKFGTPLRSSYAASKHALHGYFDSLRAELGAEGIEVLLVAPGFINTEISLKALTANGLPQMKLDEAQKKGMSPNEFAKRLIRAHEKNLVECYIGGKERFGVYLMRFCPSLFARVLRKAKVT